MIGQVMKLLSPAFYRHQYAEMIKRTSKDIVAGSVAPLFKSMLLVGVIGYTMEYMNHGRHHVAAKQAVIKEALKNHHH